MEIDMREGGELHKLASLFRHLREAWFWQHVASGAPEREWETEEAEDRRHATNLLLKEMYDRQTEGFIKGERDSLEHLMPQCAADIWSGIKREEHDTQS